MLMDFKQQKLQISVASMQTSVWAAVRMLTLHTVTAPIWRLRQYRHETKGAPGGVQGRAALRAGQERKAPGRGRGALAAVSALHQNAMPIPLSQKSKIFAGSPSRRAKSLAVIEALCIRLTLFEMFCCVNLISTFPEEVSLLRKTRFYSRLDRLSLIWLRASEASMLVSSFWARSPRLTMPHSFPFSTTGSLLI